MLSTECLCTGSSDNGGGGVNQILDAKEGEERGRRGETAEGRGRGKRDKEGGSEMEVEILKMDGKEGGDKMKDGGEKRCKEVKGRSCYRWKSRGWREEIVLGRRRRGRRGGGEEL